MVWHSEEIMNNYNLINKLVNNALKLRNDNVKYFEIGKESFNEIFNPKREKHKLRKVDIIMCVDFSKKLDADIGVFAMQTINNAFSTMGFLNSTELINTIFLGEFYLNKAKYCKNYLPSWWVN
jgi:hypothetical protein